MAAATAHTPPTSPSSPRPLTGKPRPARTMAADPSRWSPEAKPLPTIPHRPESRPLPSPAASARADRQTEPGTRPANVTVVETRSLSSAADRDLPRTPDAPPPPPHTPDLHEQLPLLGTAESDSGRESQLRPQSNGHAVPVLSVQPVDDDDDAVHGVHVVHAVHADDADDADDVIVSDSAASLPRLGSRFVADPSRLGGAATPDTDITGSDGALAEPDRDHRHSRETNVTSETNGTNATSATSASSVSGGLGDRPDSADLSPESSLEDGMPGNLEPVVPLQYHHEVFLPRQSASPASPASPASLGQDEAAPPGIRSVSNPDLLANASGVPRNLTPSSSQGFRYSALGRPQSSYSAYSDLGPTPPGARASGILAGGAHGHGHTHAHTRTSSGHARVSPDARMSSYADLLNVPYPQPSPAPITLDNAQLRSNVGSNASLLSTQKTLDMYRQNVRKTNDMSIQYSFAVFLIATAQEQGLDGDEAATSDKRKSSSPRPARDDESPWRTETDGATTPRALVREARSILQRLANAGYPFAQYYLADGYASGLFGSKGRPDYGAAFPLFVLAAKHGHAESAYRTALCYEFGWGCRRDPARAVQYLRTASAKRHPGAMTRLGQACLSGDLGETRGREGVKWLKLAAEAADAIYNAAPYQLGCLYETGYGDDVFRDEAYAAELFTQAAELGHPDANYRMGDAYEHGRLLCPRDPALSVHFYTGAAERGHAAAMMGLCAWYMVGAEPLLERDEEEAYEWARRSAELGYVKAQYTVGYFTEMGIGCRRDILEANVWYVKAADAGDERARQRLAAIRAAISGGNPALDATSPPQQGKIRKQPSRDENCAVM